MRRDLIIWQNLTVDFQIWKVNFFKIQKKICQSTNINQSEFCVVDNALILFLDVLCLQTPSCPSKEATHSLDI
jgi:hypothetical protein